MIVLTEYLPPAAIAITVQQPETRVLKLPLVLSEKPPVKDGPGGRTSGGSR